MAGVKKPLSNKERFCIHAYIATGDYVTAYVLSRENPPKTSDNKHLMQMASRWINDPRCKEFIESQQRASLKVVKEDTNTTDRSLNDTILELNALADAEIDPRKKAEILMRLADLQQWKKEDPNKDKEKSVIFYLPLTYDRMREIFVYRLKKAFDWSQEQAEMAFKIMKSAANE